MIDHPPLRRSPLRHDLDELDTARSATRVPVTSEGLDDPMRLVDLSVLPRLGFKGRNVWARIAQAGFEPPARNNSVILVPGAAIARLSDGEALILADSDGDGSALAALASLTLAEGFYPVARADTHAWMALVGTGVPAVLARMCAVDLRHAQFLPGAVAQTMVAGVAAILMRWDDRTPMLHLLVDASCAAYLFRTLLEVGADHRARPGSIELLRGRPRLPAESR